MTPAGIEPATFRFVPQHLNHCATTVPPELSKNPKYKIPQKSIQQEPSYRRRTYMTNLTVTLFTTAQKA